MPFAGPVQFPYWLTVQSNGVTANAAAQSENIPVTPGVLYTFNVIAGFTSTWASGSTISLTFYTSSGTQISSVQLNQSNMTGGVLYSWSTTATAAPSNASYAIAGINQAGASVVPQANYLNVYQAQVNDSTNTAVNINYGFSWTSYPWTGTNNATLGWNYNPLVTGDFDSLVIDGQIELMGGPPGVQCLLPELLDVNGQGPTIRILAPPPLNTQALGYQVSYDFNAPQPTQDVVASLLLDGERPFGTRASNRTLTLPVIIFGTLAGGMRQVLAAEEYLMSVIDQPAFEIKWTPADTGLGMLFDCFRALPSKPVYGFNRSAGGSASNASAVSPNYPIALLTLTIQALPYGRSDVDGMQNLAFSNGLINGPVTASAVTIDPFTSILQNSQTPSVSQLNSVANTGISYNVGLNGHNPALGDTMLVVVQGSQHGAFTVTDTQGNPYVQSYGQNIPGTSDWLYTFTAPLAAGLVNGTDHISVTTPASGNWNTALYEITGAWVPKGPNNGSNQATPVLAANGIASSYSASISGLTQYDLMLGIAFGQGSITSAPPTGWSSAGTSTENGYAFFPFYTQNGPGGTSQALNITSGLPNPWGLFVLSLIPANRLWQLDTTTPVPTFTGHSVKYNAPVPVQYPWPAAEYRATLANTVSIVNLPVLSVWFGQSYDGQWPASPKFVSNVTVSYTLTDVNGMQLTFHKTQKNTRWSSGSAARTNGPYWTQINAPVPQGKSNFSYNAIKSYIVRVTNWSGQGRTGYVRMHCWLSLLQANPQTIANATTPRGSVYNLFSLPGSARSPVNVQCQLPAEGNLIREITGPSTGYWLVPDGVYTAQAEVWGGGGGGSSLNLSRAIAGGGGGGGEYACEPVLNVTPGTKVPWTLGAGGTGAQLTGTVVQFTNPGLGHWTCPAGVTSVFAECWGGGAAGAAGGGGGGGGGYGSGTVSVTPGTTYHLWVAAGGKADTGTSAGDNFGRVGQNSWFGPPRTYHPSTSYVAASGGNTPLTGSTNGGHGATNTGMPGTTHYLGGFGGASPGPAGGGGGGAAGATGNGGNGGDSPAQSSFGRWSGSGAAGTGTGQGGNGGAGATVPGFPAKGAAPGGGGGGGYTGPGLNLGIQPQAETLGQATVNYIGADGATGMVQLTYEVGGGNAVNGGTSSFGSAATTGTVVTAHGGSSAAPNVAGGAAGGSGSSNTIHFSGGQGALYTSGPQASFIQPPFVASPFQTLSSGTFAVASFTSGAAASSCAFGVSVVLVTAATGQTISVTDSSGNLYNQVSSASANGSGSNATVYAFTANIQTPLTTSSTVTIQTGTTTACSYLWYASPYLIGGATAANLGSGTGHGTVVSSSFGTGDGTSIQYELNVGVTDSSQTLGTPVYSGKLWYAAGSTSSVTNGAVTMQAYLGINQGGGTGSSNGDNFSATASGTCNWAVLNIPLVAANQEAAVVKLDWRQGSSPGASSSWTTSASISANGRILVVGQSGTGTTAAPSGITDASGNSYSFISGATQVIPGSGNSVMWIASAPVTAGLAQGATGQIHWGNASAAPSYWHAVYWLPNAVNTGTVTAVTGSGTAISGSWTPAVPNDMTLAVAAVNQTASSTFSAMSAPWNTTDVNFNAYLQSGMWTAQDTDLSSLTASSTVSSSSPWGLVILGITQNLAGAGGGAAGGPNGPGYSAVNQFGAPGYSGGGKGGNGATTVNSGGGGAALPGGGGGGAYSNSATADAGGTGGNGMLRLTWTPPLKVFNTVILHRPGENAPLNLSPVVPIPVTDIPNNTEYSVPSLVPNVNAEYYGTYTVLLANFVWNPITIGTSRTVTVTFNQYEFPGGPRYSASCTRTFTPATDIVNGIVNMGEVTLPLKDYAAHNDRSYFTVMVNDTDQTDRFMDILTLDTTGQTYITNISVGTPGYNSYVNYYYDEPSTDKDLGYVGAATQNREHQVSVLDYTVNTGGPLYIDAGDNLLLAWSPAGAPNIGITYAPHWYISRTV